MSTEIKNKVAESGILTIDLEKLAPRETQVIFDLKDLLWQELVLKEKDFREFVKTNDWSSYNGKYVGITCSADAVVPNWAYMLITSALQPFAKGAYCANAEELNHIVWKEILQAVNLEEFSDARVMVKGCSNMPIPTFAYVELTRLLQPVVKSLMFGEPCSAVPVFKRK